MGVANGVLLWQANNLKGRVHTVLALRRGPDCMGDETFFNLVADR